MQNNKQKVFKLPKDFNTNEKGFSSKRKVTYQEILLKTVFSMPPQQMMKEFMIIQKRDKLKMIITPFGILSADLKEMKKLTDMLIKSVQYN